MNIFGQQILFHSQLPMLSEIDEQTIETEEKKQSFKSGFREFIKKSHFKSDKDRPKKVSLYGNKSVCNPHHKISTHEDEAINSSSFYSNSGLPDFIGDVLDNNTYCLKKPKNSPFKTNKKGLRTAKSDQKRILKFSEVEEKLFDHVSIIQIREKKRLIEESRQSLDGSYSYMMKKLSKINRNNQLQQVREKKLSEIKRSKRKLSQSLHRSQSIFNTIDKQYKKAQRLLIQNQRMNKDQRISLLHEQNHLSASQQRLFKKQNQDRMALSSEKSFEEKRHHNEKERKQNKKRRNIICRKVQERKEKAKDNFRNRWITQFKEVEQAKKLYFKKEQMIVSRMQDVFQSYPQHLNQSH